MNRHALDFDYNAEELEQYSMACMKPLQICALFNITQEQFDWKKANDPNFKRVLILGRAKVQLMCEQTLLRAAQGEKSLDPEQVQAAKFWLQNHSTEMKK